MNEECRVRQTSWTGSENERREQGICLPPTRPAKKGSRFFVPVRTPCAISRVSPLGWRSYITRKDVGFERFESYRAGVFEFRSDVGGWLMRVHRRHVQHRADRGFAKD
jgi:hypothetical protein